MVLSFIIKHSFYFDPVDAMYATAYLFFGLPQLSSDNQILFVVVNYLALNMGIFCNTIIKIKPNILLGKLGKFEYARRRSL